MKIAVIHDWLVEPGGAELVLREILNCYPEADLFCVVDFLADKHRHFTLGKRASTTFVQRLPFAAKRYRAYLPLMPLAIEQLDLSAYDLVISSSYAVAKGVLTGPNQVHVSYVHSPIRYAWDMQHQYLREGGLQRGLKGALARIVLSYLRIWDSRTANGVDAYMANSHFIARRIAKVYRRDATVVHPPVALDDVPAGAKRGDYYVTASRMVPYKRMDLIAEAFTAMPDKRLVIIGDGPEMAKVRSKAGPNVEILGYQPRDVLLNRLSGAKAFVFAAEEDFGIAPLEAQAMGTPVIAFGKGGALESVVGAGVAGRAPTGLFFDEQSVSSLVDAVQRFERDEVQITSAACRANAERFSPERFRAEFKAVVVDALVAAHRT
jgi:glycosyltransferase involved in cell wall biosynthesis